MLALSPEPPAPGDADQSHRPPARLAPSRPYGPSPAPPPTCCRRGRFHLHLPLTRARPGSGFPQTRPRPAPARPRALGSPQTRPRPPVNTPPLSPRPDCRSGKGCAGAGGRGAGGWTLPGSARFTKTFHHPLPALGRCGECGECGDPSALRGIPRLPSAPPPSTTWICNSHSGSFLRPQTQWWEPVVGRRTRDTDTPRVRLPPPEHRELD